MGIGRRSNPADEAVGRRFRGGRGAALRRQRAIASSALVATVALSVVGCYQLG